MNKIDDALKPLPDGLTWAQAMDLHREAVMPLWRVSGKVSADDVMTDADRYRLADAIVKKQQTSPKEENTMTSTTDENMFDDENRPYLLAAQKHRAKLQRSSDEDLFSIARRLRTQVETARAADARKPDATLSDTDRLALHRPGWRLNDDSWRHDRRKKRTTTHEFDPAGREAGTFVSEEDDEEDKRNGIRSEEALSDIKTARAEYLDYLHNAYKLGR